MVGRKIRVSVFALCLIVASGCSSADDQENAGTQGSLGDTTGTDASAVEAGEVAGDGEVASPSALPVVVVQQGDDDGGDEAAAEGDDTTTSSGADSTTGSTAGDGSTTSSAAAGTAGQAPGSTATTSGSSSTAPASGSSNTTAAGSSTTAGRSAPTIRVSTTEPTTASTQRSGSTERTTTTRSTSETTSRQATTTARQTTTTSRQTSTTARQTTTTARQTTTTARPATTTTQRPTQPTTAVGRQLFFEDFSGSGSLSRFLVDVYHRDDFIIDDQSWVGDHAVTGPGDLCGAPEEKRQITRGDRASGFNLDWIYRCVPGGDLSKAHIMTSIGDTSGYSIGAFTPNQTFTGVREVRWDVNITDLGLRQFTEVKVVPSNRFNFQDLPCAIDLPCSTSDVGDLDAVAASFFNHVMHIHNGSSLIKDDVNWFRSSPNDPALSSIRTRRTQFFRDNGNGTLTMGVEREDGSFREMTVSGRFPSGAVRVVFGDHSYTPNKANAPSYTWHWDDIEIRGS